MALAPSPPTPLPLKGVRGVWQVPRLRQRRGFPPPTGEGDRRRRWRGTFRVSLRQKVRIARACPSPMLRMVPLLILGRICNHHPSPQRRLGPIAPVDLARHTSWAPAFAGATVFFDGIGNCCHRNSLNHPSPSGEGSAAALSPGQSQKPRWVGSIGVA
jgi:hypothetical protein